MKKIWNWLKSLVITPSKSIQITEENDQELIAMWETQAKNQTLETLPMFLESLVKDYKHDYGTICHAIAIASLATKVALNKSEQGGITGFQASAIMWLEIALWQPQYKGVPMKLVAFKDMLYPQYEYQFDKTMPQSTFDWLKQQAIKLLDDHDKPEDVAPAVRKHWANIATGKVPFGYKIVD